MLYGVFSDIHSNLEALEAVLAFFEGQGVQGYICCGDIVGYGPDPDACLTRIRALPNLSIICGNHDLAVIERLDVNWFNAYAKAAVFWTREALSADNRAYLESLTANVEGPEFSLAHGSPRRPAEEYLLSVQVFRDNMSLVHKWPLFIGHSHMPLFFTTNEDGQPEMSWLVDGQEVLVTRMPFGMAPAAFNPGSAGQPRDQDPRAACGVYDSERGAFRLVRLPYDVGATQNKIRDAGLPEFLALRLGFGQ